MRNQTDNAARSLFIAGVGVSRAVEAEDVSLPFEEVAGLFAEDVGGVGVDPEDDGAGEPGFPTFGGGVEAAQEGRAVDVGEQGVVKAGDKDGVPRGVGQGGVDVLEDVAFVGPQSDDFDGGEIGLELLDEEAAESRVIADGEVEGEGAGRRGDERAHRADLGGVVAVPVGDGVHGGSIREAGSAGHARLGGDFDFAGREP